MNDTLTVPSSLLGLWPQLEAYFDSVSGLRSIAYGGADGRAWFIDITGHDSAAATSRYIKALADASEFFGVTLELGTINPDD